MQLPVALVPGVSPRKRVKRELLGTKGYLGPLLQTELLECVVSLARGEGGDPAPAPPGVDLLLPHLVFYPRPPLSSSCTMTLSTRCSFLSPNSLRTAPFPTQPPRGPRCSLLFPPFGSVMYLL